MAFIIVTQSKENLRTAVNVDNIRTILDTDELPTIVMVSSGHMSYNIVTRESFDEIGDLITKASGHGH